MFGDNIIVVLLTALEIIFKCNGLGEDKNDLRFAYLLQDSTVRRDNRLLETANRDIFWLTFEVEELSRTNRYVFSPNSTWTTGRNTLLSLALDECVRQNGTRDYDYLIFMDADVLNMIKGKGSDPWERFESWLKNQSPRVGYLTNAVAWQSSGKEKNVVGRSNVDAILTAFHRSALGLILPYDDTLDKLSVYYSAYIMNTIIVGAYRHVNSRVGWSVLTFDRRQNRHGKRTSYTRKTQWKVPADHIHSAFRSKSITQNFVANAQGINGCFSTCDGPSFRADQIDEKWVRSNMVLEHPYTHQRMNFLKKYDSLLNRYRETTFAVECAFLPFCLNATDGVVSNI